MNIVTLLQVAGASMIVLALLHGVFWRTLRWNREVERLSPLAARVFAVQTFFIAFVLMSLGLLSLARPALLVAQSELARVLLFWIVVFWAARLLLQPLVFNRVMQSGPIGHKVFRVGATLLWAAYVAVYAVALLRQFGVAS